MSEHKTVPPIERPLRNEMAQARSPYLLQHKDNPVHWQFWSEQAFELARARDVPVLLSVGYAACHWCHVMAHESFEDDGIATYLNAHFICIKVDREERPDVDAVYMAATTAYNHGRGGWPMTVLLTPDKRPFFAGTYFPPRSQRGMPGFLDILQHLKRAWDNQRAELDASAQALTEAITPDTSVPNEAALSAPGTQALHQRALAALTQRFDTTDGGFTPAPKFLHTEMLRLLLMRQHSAPEAGPMARATLDAMALGGLHDLVGGGFSRYSVDAEWRVPHFEKMLYDNALMATTYAEAALACDEAVYGHIARRTLDFVLRELSSEAGTFFASLDADSEGHEGKFYVWAYHEAQACLQTEMSAQQAERLLAQLGITEAGNWEAGSNIVRVAHPEALVSPEVQHALALLAAAREPRVRPGTDTKVLTGHNGLMLTALAAGARALADDRYLTLGLKAAGALAKQAVSQDGSVTRTPLEHDRVMPGMLEDYAYLAEGLIALYEAGGPAKLLTTATQILRRMVALFADAETGALYETSTEHEALLFRNSESHDGATPSAAATAVHVLWRLARHTGDGQLAEAAERAACAVAQEVQAAPFAHCRMLMALDFHHASPAEAVLVGRTHPEAARLWRALTQRFDPHRLIAHDDEMQADPALPLLLHRPLQDGRPTAYLCLDHACGLPITEVEALHRALKEAGPIGARGYQS